jgi:hypothetical protein
MRRPISVTKGRAMTDVKLSPEQAKEFRARLLKRMSVTKELFESRGEDDARILGEILHCHLVAEHLILRYIKWLHPAIGPIETSVVRHFGEKLRMAKQLDNGALFFSDHVPSLDALNKIRNKLSHDIYDVKVNSDDLSPMRQLLTARGFRLQGRPDVEVAKLYVVNFAIDIAVVEITSEMHGDSIKEFARAREEYVSSLKDLLRESRELLKNHAEK